MAMPMLAEADTQLTEFGSDFARHMPSSERRRFTSGITIGAEALADFREWIRTARPAMNGTVAVGSEAYDGFLKKVALIPYSADELIAMGRQELARAIAFEQFESVRNSSLPPLPYFPGIESQMITSTHEEEAMRVFLPERGILDVPEWMGHYRNAPIPAYLFPLRWLAVDDDLTSVSRLGQDATKYIPAPSPDLSYFDRATAQDPRPILVHEGIPGHFFQLALSWSNPDPLRRHYFDSGANEGIGFYAEEMMLQNGYFDDRPRVREIIYNFMRLRAIRVEVDVRLARGEFSIDDAAAYLERMVPMSHADALDEAAFFASTPGQAITYQIGKLQIMKLIADARMQLGDAFNLRTLHNYIWLNGNVPIALLRWEYLGQRDEVDRLLGKK